MTINGIYDQQSGDLLIDFDTYIENSYHNSNTVAFEPLEEGTFSSDSKQNTPFQLSLTIVKSISTGNPNIVLQTVNQVKQTLEDLAASDTLVSLTLQPMVNQSKDSRSQYIQYGKSYQNLTLYSIDYQNTPDQLEFRPTLLFQEIRMTNTEYSQSQNTANPENSSTVNQGQVQPQPTNTTILQDFISFISGGS